MLKKLDIIQAKALRIILGAVKTTPTAALQVETSEMPLYRRREKLAMAYWINLQGQSNDHPAKGVLKESWETMNTPGKGFAWKIKKQVNETGLDIKLFAPIIVTPPIPPWLLAQPEIDLKLHEKIKEKGDEVNVKTFVEEYKNTHFTQMGQRAQNLLEQGCFLCSRI